ncbi:MAG TPA: hypothetical protein VHE55_13875 [Fimbriimonadaceae bacterium]|nr:hypothetical protein [Fimbriimonadaceae bacterium]
MDESASLGRKILFWLISPGAIKLAISLCLGGVTISYLSRLKADQVAARQAVPARPSWQHGTSDTRLQRAIDADDGQAVSRLLLIIPREKIRDNIIDRLSFDKTAHALEAFLSNGWSPNGVGNNGVPVVNAVRAGQARALAVLLKHGANPNVRDDMKRPAMLWAGSGFRTSPTLIELLVRAGAKIDEVATYPVRVNRRPKMTLYAKDRAITIAAFSGNIAGIRTLIRLGANVNPVPGENLPPLAAAAYAKHSYDLTKLLLDAGADPNSEGIAYLDGPNGTMLTMRASAIFLNSWFDHSDTVKLLLERGADPTRKTSTGETVAGVANPETAEVLRQAGLALRK